MVAGGNRPGMAGTVAFDFSGESAIVTGSTKGIGRGIAETLADAGANVVINSRTREDAEQVASEIDTGAEGTVVGVPADVGDPDGVEHLVETAIDEVGPIDLLVNNAAVWPREGSLVEASLEDWEQTMAVDVRAGFYAATLVARHMIEEGVEGSVVNVTSQTGDRRCGGRGLYGIANTAVNGLTWRLAHDFADHGIRVNAVSTDVTDSYQLRYEAEQVATEADDRTAEDVLREWGEARPLGRLGRPRDLGNAVCYLASEQADYVVGTILRVAGGGNLE